MLTSEQINELATALALAQGAFRAAPRGGVNNHTAKTYTTLADILEVTREPLATNGLCVVQTPEICDDPGRIALTTRLMHSSGQWIESTIVFPAVKQEKMAEIHGMMSALTYARRAGLSSMLGIAGEADDDGNAAAGRAAKAGKPPVGGSLAGTLNDTGAQCSSCNAPSGKPHLASCKDVGQARA